MAGLPPDIEAYRRTPEFTADTVPAGLLRDHATKAGVWGVIHVLAGEVAYVVRDDSHPQLLSPQNPGIVEPEVPHRVSPSPDARFYVEFYRMRRHD